MEDVQPIRKTARDTISTPPNVILITTDQQRCDTLGCYDSRARTPEVDAFARSAYVFDRAYCSNPVCTPSRVSLMTGLYPSHHGAWNVGVNAPEDLRFLSHRFLGAGYRTHHIGKAHFNAYHDSTGKSKERLNGDDHRFKEFNGPYYGFETIEISIGHTTFGAHGHYRLWLEQKLGSQKMDFPFQKMDQTDHSVCSPLKWDMPLELHNTTWTAERSCVFLEEAARGRKPFFLNIGFQDPHPPFALPRALCDSLNKNVPSRRFQEGEHGNNPPHFDLIFRGKIKNSRFWGEYPMAGQAHGVDYSGVREEDSFLTRQYYFQMVEWIDQALGKIFAKLRELNLEEDTLVILTSDHGEMLGDHGLWHKGPTNYEEVIRIPLVVRIPGMKGGRIGSLASLVDIAPTLAECCGLSEVETDGISLLPAMKGAPLSRNTIFNEHTEDPRTLSLVTVITERHIATSYRGESFGELFDLVEDPFEFQNRWNDPSFKSVRDELCARIPDDMKQLPKTVRVGLA